MHWFIVICLALAVVFMCGCGTLKKVDGHPIADVFKTALSVAANVLANEGTQKLAVAAAQAAVISQIQEPTAQAAACQAIATVIPEVATGISQLLTRGETRKASMEDKYDQYTHSAAFNEMVLKCTQEYDRELRK